MTLKDRQNGFTLVESLLVIIAIAVVAFVGVYVYNSVQDKDSKNSTNTSKKQETKPDETKDWTSYSNEEFSLRYPMSWVTAPNQESCGNNLLLGSTEQTVASCQSDGTSQIMFTVNETAEVEGGPEGLSEDAYTDIKTSNVKVDGVTGKRQTGTYQPNEEIYLGPQPGTKEIRYEFKTAGKTYTAFYVQDADYPDVQHEFDLIVTKTLKFK